MGSFPLYEKWANADEQTGKEEDVKSPTSAIRQSGQESFNLNLLLCVMLGKIWSFHV